VDDEIFTISKDKPRAIDLVGLAKDRFQLIKILPKDKIYKFIEEYYEIVKELLTTIMYLDGYKTLSHKALIEYFASKYNNILDSNKLRLLDQLRKLRNGIMYYGEKISRDFLINNEKEITQTIRILFKFLEKRLKNEN
jgi:hypothetical protein